ncbi:hypothetical protein [Xanthomonas sp. BRIP62411]|jgi:hypothetical protein|uniref:hypothetical protein n=1 Tax=Xanthomonas sp. BRIP62411 TaxID=2182389 RepID=UPI000F8E5958|nr:hypothetical protein [Xanthomonas sp. BRIP62411]
METEGEFRLEAVVGEDVRRPGHWHAAGSVHHGQERNHVAQVAAGTEFPSREAAYRGGIDAARAVAKTLPPGYDYATYQAEKG